MVAVWWKFLGPIAFLISLTVSCGRTGYEADFEVPQESPSTYDNSPVGDPVSQCPNSQDDGATDDATCDGVDDDCDGTADEDYVPTPTTCGQGACSGNTGLLTCSAGVQFDSCDPFAGAAASDGICDGVDNDCDGSVDEDYTPTPTTCGQGACGGNSGVLTCSGGIEVDSCNPFAGAAANDATCDGVDSDCDGSVDEDYTPTPTTCTLGACSGHSGFLMCGSGVESANCDIDVNGVCDDIDADILFWIDASDAASLTTTTGDVTDGALIESWANRSMHGASLVTYNTTNGQAQYVAAHFPNGSPGIEFIDAFMEAREVDVQPSVVPQLTSIAAVQYLDHTSGAPSVWVGVQNGFTRREHSGITANTHQISTRIFDQSAPFCRHWEDGVMNDDGGTTFAEEGPGIGVGQWLYAWHGYDGTYHQNVVIGELIILRGALNDTRREAVEQYLRAKWGL